ncbi:MAG: S9 family peptidase [Ignavibacteria bacterium]|nr:S9 family peptidase [Ignavibacteria bacterium]
MKKIIILIVFFFLTNSTEISFCQTKIKYPETKKVPHIDNYFGIDVPDPYRWLEDMESPEVKEWVDVQNEVTFDYLESIPYREKIKERLTELWDYPRYSAPFKSGENFFFYKNDGLQNQSVVYIQKDLNSEPEVFIDPNKFSEDGTVALSTLSASKDGKYVVYGMSNAGSDWVEFFVIDIESKKQLKDHIKWVKFSGASWYRDGFYYKRFDKPEEGKELISKNDNQKVYFHRVGTDQSEDVLVYEDPEHPNRFFYISPSEDERYLYLSISEKGENGNSIYFRDNRKADLDWHPIVEGFEYDYWVVNNIDDEIFIITNKNAPKRKLVKLNPNQSQIIFEDVIPEKVDVLSDVTLARNKFIATYLKDASDHIFVYDVHGNLLEEIKLPTLGSVYGFRGKKEDNELFYTFTSYTHPSTIYKYNVDEGKSELYRKTEAKYNPDDYETKQVFFESKDGTKVPMFIVNKKGIKLDGNNPTLLYGYGGFNISFTPHFESSLLVFLENGGVYALANLRGGGEYGEEWHKAGMVLNKQNVFDDFISAAEYLIENKYTSPEKLAIEGGSNGGLLVGAVMTQRPELFKVALPGKGVLDMLRFHEYTIGWAWITEYGTSEDSVQFRNLLSYSPLQNLKDGVNYPATLVTTSDHDDRVVPMHSYKYIATLQEKQAGDAPVLLRVETNTGHGFGKPLSKIIDVETDIWSFVFSNLGMNPSY